MSMTRWISYTLSLIDMQINSPSGQRTALEPEAILARHTRNSGQYPQICAHYFTQRPYKYSDQVLQPTRCLLSHHWGICHGESVVESHVLGSSSESVYHPMTSSFRHKTRWWSSKLSRWERHDIHKTPGEWRWRREQEEDGKKNYINYKNI